MSELASYPLLAIIKLLGVDFVDLRASSLRPKNAAVETFTKIDLTYPQAVATARTGIGVKSKGELIVAGTEGYLYVPAPWWKTEYFETRFEDPARARRYYSRFEGDGLRYELAEFVSMIRAGDVQSFKLRPSESIAIAEIIEAVRRDSVPFGVAQRPFDSS